MASVTQAPAAAGKGKQKKSKGTKLDVNEFLGDSNFKMVDSSWADIMEDEDVVVPVNISLPSAPKSTLGPEFDIDSIPSGGPFKVQVANLQYEVTDEMLAGLFENLSIKYARVNTENGRANGTGAVEFNSKQDLVSALNYNNRQLNGRSIRIYLPNQGGDRYGDRGGRGGPRGSYTDNTPMNWRSMDRTAPRGGSSDGFPPRSEKVFPPPTVGYGSGGGGGYGSRGSRYGDSDGYRPPRSDFGGRRDFDGDRRRDDGYGRRDGGFGGRRDRYEGGDSAEQPEGGNWRTAPRAEPAPTQDRDGGFGGRRERYDGDGRADSFEPAPRSFAPAPREPREPQLQREPRERTMSGRSIEPDYDAAPRSFAPAPREPREPLSHEPRERTFSGRSDRSNDHEGGAPHKIEEAPRRTAPPVLRPGMLANLLEGDDTKEAKPSSYNSIFGSAKPVDTLKREMEIEKKLAEEKALQAEKEAAAKAEAAASGSATGSSPAGSTTGEPGTTRPPRDRVPRGDGTTPPPRMARERRENGEREHRGPPRDGGDRRRNDGRYGDRERNGMGRRDGEGRRDGDSRPRMGQGGAGMGGRRDGGSRDGGYGGSGYGERRGPGGYGDRRVGGDGPRGSYRNDGPSDRFGGGGDGPRGGYRNDAPSDRYGGGYRGAGSGGYERDYGNRYLDEDKDGPKVYTTNNKFDSLLENEDQLSE